MKKWTYTWAMALMMAIPTWAMQGFAGNHSQAPGASIPQTILCSRLTLQEHQKLATEPDVTLLKKNLSDGDLKTLLPLMQNNPSLTKLDLFRNNIGANGAKILASLPALRILNLEENKLGDEGAAVFESNTTLAVLNLFKNGITDLGVIPLARNTTLQELGLYGNQITDCGASALSANRSLRKLDVRGNQITDKGAQSLASHSTLEIICLGRNTITDIGAKAFLNKDNFRHVELKGAQVSDGTVKLFEQAFPHNGFLICTPPQVEGRLPGDQVATPAPNSFLLTSQNTLMKKSTMESLQKGQDLTFGQVLPDLKPITVQKEKLGLPAVDPLPQVSFLSIGCEATGKGREEPEGVNVAQHGIHEQLPLFFGAPLQSLDLSGQTLDDAQMQSLTQNTTLTSLNLKNSRISNAGVQILAQSATLTSLNLRNSCIGETGIQSLAQNTTLTSLNLRDNAVGLEGARGFAQNSILKKLNLENNSIGIEGAQILAQNTTLTSLNLRNNCIGDAGKMALLNSPNPHLHNSF